MEKTRAKADIHWLTYKEGGRVAPLHWDGLERGYWGVAGFEGEEDWSVKVFATPQGTDFSLEFNSDAAPHHLLVPGAKFELKEGRHVVARGEIR